MMLILRWREKDGERDLNLYVSAQEAKEWLGAIQKAQAKLLTNK